MAKATSTVKKTLTLEDIAGMVQGVALAVKELGGRVSALETEPEVPTAAKRGRPVGSKNKKANGFVATPEWVATLEAEDFFALSAFPRQYLGKKQIFGKVIYTAGLVLQNGRYLDKNDRSKGKTNELSANHVTSICNILNRLHNDHGWTPEV